MADKVEIAEDILKLSFEEALGELESIVDASGNRRCRIGRID